jgi:hypothetical protein
MPDSLVESGAKGDFQPDARRTHGHARGDEQAVFQD